MIFPWIFKENLVSFKLELLCTTSKLGCALKIETVCVQKIVISYKIFFRTSCHFYATQLLMFAQNVYSSGIKKALHIWSPLLRTLVNGIVSRIFDGIFTCFWKSAVADCLFSYYKSLKLLMKKKDQEVNQHPFQDLLMKIGLHFIVRIINYLV